MLYLKKVKYQVVGGKQPRFERVEFKNNNKDLLSNYPLTVVYLTPDIDEESQLDQDAFLNH